MRRRALLVGELNPYGPDEEFALYPSPRNSAGGRLCRVVMGLGEDEYLDSFERANLCARKWSLPRARERARELRELYADVPIVLLGAKVSKAFGVAYAPFCWHESDADPPCMFAVLPHPSGLCRTWNESGAYARARAVLRECGVLEKEDEA